MKQIMTRGIYNLEPLEGSPSWYWGMDYTSGDLYEAEELFQDGHPVRQNRLILVRYPDGTVFEPVRPQAGQYLGRPVCHDGRIVLLLADFPKAEFRIIAFDEKAGQTAVLAVLPRTIAEDCYNLLLDTPPLMLTRSANDNKFQILWPEHREFELEAWESFCFRAGDKLYCTVWHQEPDYWEELLVRDWNTGAVLSRTPGTVQSMPDGQKWFLA